MLLHGLGSSSGDWSFQVPALAARHRVVTPDLRGHGRSPRGRGSLTVGAMADDVASLLATLDVGPAHVVGLSLGGCVALALALDHSRRVRSLTLVNAFARPQPNGPGGAFRFATRLGLLACAPMSVVGTHIARGLFPRPDQRELRLSAAARLGANPRGTYVTCLRALLAFDVRRRLGEIRCPTLIVAGDRDTTVPLAAKRLLQASIPRADLRIVADSGHVTPCDQPERFNTLLLGFLDGVA